MRLGGSVLESVDWFFEKERKLIRFSVTVKCKTYPGLPLCSENCLFFYIL